MFKRLFLMLAILAASFTAIYAWKAKQFNLINQQMSRVVPVAVSVVQVKTETWQPYLSAVGNLTSSKGVSVSNEVAGQVSAIRFVSGQKVTKGDRLVQLDDSIDQADLKALKAEQTFARLQVNRDKKLIKGRYISDVIIDQDQSRFDLTTARVESKLASIAKKQIRAPFSGWLGIRQVNLGEYLAPGTAIVSLHTLDPIFVDYQMPQKFSSQLHLGQSVQLLAEGFPDRRFEGQISAIAPELDRQSRSIKIRASLPNPDTSLHPGMFVHVQTLLPTQDNVLTIPQSAITYAPYGDAVFVIEAQGGHSIALHHPVETGEVRNGRVEILSGLSVGQQVAVAGQVKLRNEMPVSIKKDAASHIDSGQR